MAKIRYMSWNIENYGDKKDKKHPDLPKMIAKVAKLYEIDIIAIIEFLDSHNSILMSKIITALDNNGPSAKWSGEYILANSMSRGKAEGVGFFWREKSVNSDDIKKIDLGKVMFNQDGKNIFFPETKTKWINLPLNITKDEIGRTVAFVSLEVNGKLINCLNLHTPFADNKIQAYSAYLYANSAEVKYKSRNNEILNKIKDTNFLNNIKSKVIPDNINSSKTKQITFIEKSNYSNHDKEVINEVVDSVILKMRERFIEKLSETNNLLNYLIDYDDKFNSLFEIRNKLNKKLTTIDNKKGLMDIKFLFYYMFIGIFSLIREIVPIKKDINVKKLMEQQKVFDEIEKLNCQLRKKGSCYSELGNLIYKCFDILKTNLMDFSLKFDKEVDVSLSAGDFNIDYPDKPDKYKDDASYVKGEDKREKLGDKTKGHAYYQFEEILKAKVGIKNGTEGIKTTQNLPDKDFKAYFKFDVFIPNYSKKLQDSDNKIENTYVNTDALKIINDLKAKNLHYDNYDNFISAINTELKTKSLSDLTQDEKVAVGYHSIINYNNTTYFKSQAYDNIFIYPNTTKTYQCEVVDMLSELGKWDEVDFNPAIKWDKSKGNLNSFPQEQWNFLKNSLESDECNFPCKVHKFKFNECDDKCTYEEDTTKKRCECKFDSKENKFSKKCFKRKIKDEFNWDFNTRNAGDAALFYKNFVSDHYPVYVEVEV